MSDHDLFAGTDSGGNDYLLTVYNTPNGFDRCIAVRPCGETTFGPEVWLRRVGDAGSVYMDTVAAYFAREARP